MVIKLKLMAEIIWNEFYNMLRFHFETKNISFI